MATPRLVTTMLPVGPLAADPTLDGAPDDLSLHWRLDGDLADAAGHGHSGSAIGNCAFADGLDRKRCTLPAHM
jgi:hypothetical protein